MEIFALSFVIFILAGLGMSIGLVLKRRPICSGCHAVAQAKGGRLRCLICPNNRRDSTDAEQ